TPGSRSISRLARPSEPQAARRGPLPRRFVIGLAAWLLAVAACASTAAAQMVDTLVAVGEARTVGGGDIRLARGLGAVGFTDSAAPMGRKDIEHYVDVVLVLQESERIGISVESAETDRAWDAAVARAGGEAAVQRWLDGNAIDRDWARHAVELDVRRQKFLAE